MDYLIERLKEPSTWRGIVLLATAFGVPIAPAEGEAVIAVGLAVSGLIGVLAKDRRDTPPTNWNDR